MRSTYGEGATFTVGLPRSVEAGTVEEQVHRALIAADDTVVTDEPDAAVDETHG